MSRVIHYFSSEFGWTVDEILHRTVDELELLLEVGLEKKQEESQSGAREMVGPEQSQVPTLRAEDPNQLKAFARQVGVQVKES